MTPRPFSPGAGSRRTPDDGDQHPTVALVSRYWLVVLLWAVAGALLAFGASRLVTPTYSATSTLYFSITYGASGTDLNQGSSYAQDQMLSFAELGRSALVLQPVIDSLDLAMPTSALAGMIEVRAPQNTVVLDIIVGSSDPALAAEIANETASSLITSVRDVAPLTESGASTVTVRTVTEAAVPTVASAPNVRVNVVAGALIGLMAAVLSIVIRRFLNTRIHAPGDLESVAGVPVLATVRTGPEGSEPAGREGFRRLQAMIGRTPEPIAARGGRPVPARTIVLTSATADGDASLIATRFAAELAGSGERVLLVAAGDRGDPVPELDDVDVVDAWEGVPPGATLPTAALTTPLAQPVGSYDYILVDAPPLATSATALAAGRLVQGVVLTAHRGVRAADVRAALRDLGAAGIEVIGTVLADEPARPRQRAAAPRYPWWSTTRPETAEVPRVTKGTPLSSSTPNV